MDELDAKYDEKPGWIDGFGSEDCSEDLVERVGTAGALWIALMMMLWSVGPVLYMERVQAVFISVAVCYSAVLFSFYYIAPFGVGWAGFAMTAIAWVATALIQIFLKMPPFFSSVVGGIGLCAFAYGAGRKLADTFKSSHHVLPAFALIAAADIWRAIEGVATIADRWPELNKYFSLSLPIIGTRQVMPVIGFADFIFIAIFFGLAARFGMNMILTTLGLLVGGLTFFLVATTWSTGLTMLPFLAVMFCLVNWKKTRPTLKESRLIISYIVFFILMVVLYYAEK